MPTHGIVARTEGRVFPRRLGPWAGWAGGGLELYPPTWLRARSVAWDRTDLDAHILLEEELRPKFLNASARTVESRLTVIRTAEKGLEPAPKQMSLTPWETEGHRITLL